jgi:hypothetical protein
VLQSFPSAVQDEVGYALFLAQRGEKHIAAKPMKGPGGGVLEVVADHRGDTFRVVLQRAPDGPLLRSPRFPELVEARHRDATGRDRLDQAPVEAGHRDQRGAE